MNNNESHGNKFFDGFLWGAIIGGGLVFLLGTKKGKKLLKAVTQGGMESLTDLMEEGMEAEGEFDEETEDLENPAPNGLSEEKRVREEKPVARKRFFRRRVS